MNASLHVIIVGGGIGGLFAANALRAHGFAVAVYEQAPPHQRTAIPSIRVAASLSAAVLHFCHR